MALDFPPPSNGRRFFLFSESALPYNAAISFHQGLYQSCVGIPKGVGPLWYVLRCKQPSSSRCVADKGVPGSQRDDRISYNQSLIHVPHALVYVNYMGMLSAYREFGIPRPVALSSTLTSPLSFVVERHIVQELYTF